jgi:hypothetical protein
MTPSLAPPTLWGGKRVVLRLHIFGFEGFGTASRRQAERGCPSTVWATVAPCAGPPHPQHPLRRRPPQATLLRHRPGSRTRRHTPWRWRPRSWMVLSSPPYEDGGECLLSMAHTLRWSPPLASHLSGTIIRGTLKTPNSQLVTPISIKLQRSDGCD